MTIAPPVIGEASQSYYVFYISITYIQIMIEGLEKLLAAGKDNALLRFGLGKGYLDAGNYPVAATHLTQCVAFDPAYTAAWKLLGKARQGAGDVEGARDAWTRGIAAAQAHGDRQAEKEMTVFLKRLG
ncbi:hypothetical protein [Pandoraea pnomenusa]|jgi:tetratricopeptide (TPR) repeat protein|uniref:Zn-dependent protease, contains TPR repeats n=2 Tax=Pandoraea pnomenusa TaxID=93220 RepID=A0A378YG40_9BURK|nr:hypothetical protein [Pandoraea pnomenusa]SUA75387.1 Putative Zn-dependent protease, contains TPR repeats [Pandoraea pnomenusa]